MKIRVEYEFLENFICNLADFYAFKDKNILITI